MRIILLLCAAAVASIPVVAAATQQTGRTIVSDDFVNQRPKSKRLKRHRTRIYRPASTPLAANLGAEAVQVGVTIWKLPRARAAHSQSDQGGPWESIARRVEAGTQFRYGDLLRISIESKSEGYLYVVDRDWFSDGSSGETNLIFPARGEDNRLEAGKLIDIPAPNLPPFKTEPKPNQGGELLTIIITKTPLTLALSQNALPISDDQLAEWERRWSSLTERFELIGGAGLARTLTEQRAASTRDARQLTRDDPPPQTIYYLTPRNSDGFLFNLMLSYAR